MRWYVFLSKILLMITPVFYFLKNVSPLLKYIKDFLILFLGTTGFFILIKSKAVSKRIYPFVFFFIFIVLISLLNFEDKIFYFISLREMVFYPFFYITISLVLQYYKIDFNKYIYKGSLLCLGLLYIYLVLYTRDSFGPTARFRGFFDREHLPSVYASLAIITSLFYTEKKLLRVIIVSTSLIVMMITGTRSVFLFMILIYLLYVIKLSFKSMLGILFTSGFIFFLYKIYFVRDVFYNLEGRTSQYALALSSIKDNFFIGIGIDKYGVLGKIIKRYTHNGYTTVTMDSNFIKYFVNLGVPLIFTYLLFLYKRIYFYTNTNKEYKIMVKRVLYFIFCMGMITGKFAAYPLNMVFFMNIILASEQFKLKDVR